MTSESLSPWKITKPHFDCYGNHCLNQDPRNDPVLLGLSCVADMICAKDRREIVMISIVLF